MDKNIIRTFLCIPISNEIASKKNMLFSTIDNSKIKVNWVKNSNLHLTVKFIGQTPQSSIKKVIYSIASITKDFPPFKLRIKGTGCFPNKRKPKNLWLGVQNDYLPLSKLIERVENNLFELGFEKETKLLTPHITIAKINYPQKITPDISIFLNSSYDVIDLNVNRLQFFSSELLSNGAIYSLLKTFPLGESI